MTSLTFLFGAAVIALATTTVHAAEQPAPADKVPTAQQQRMKDCNAQAAGRTGDERKAFMSACLKGDTAKPMTQQERMTDCNKQASGKNLKGDDRKAFMSTCLKGQSAAPMTQQERMTDCNKQASGKNLKGDDRKTFMSACLKG